VIVDWKSASMPGEKELEKKKLQLLLYRYMYSVKMQIDPQLVETAFYFAGTNTTEFVKSDAFSIDNALDLSVDAT
jgi:hypothetical protein